MLPTGLLFTSQVGGYRLHCIPCLCKQPGARPCVWNSAPFPSAGTIFYLPKAMVASCRTKNKFFYAICIFHRYTNLWSSWIHLNYPALSLWPKERMKWQVRDRLVGSLSPTLSLHLFNYSTLLQRFNSFSDSQTRAFHMWSTLQCMYLEKTEITVLFFIQVNSTE